MAIKWGGRGFGHTSRYSAGVSLSSASSAIALSASVWAFGASSMAGGQIAAATTGGTEDGFTNTVRAIEGLAANSLAYTTVGGSQTARPIDYNLTGVNSAYKIRNRAVSGQTTGSAGTIASTMSAASGSFGASDFMVLHQGDNGVSSSGNSNVELITGGYAALIREGDSTVTASLTTDTPIAPGAVEVMTLGATHVAGITAGTAATLYITLGDGI